MKYEQNRERKNALNKIALTTAGVIAGGALLKKTGIPSHAAKAFGDVSKTMSKVTKDINLAGRKGLTADGISDIFRKRISNDDSTWKLARKNNITEINLKDRGIFKDLKDLDNVPIKMDEIRNKRLDSEIREDIMNTLDQRFNKNKERNKDFMEDLYNLTDRALKRQDAFFEQGTEAGSLNSMLDEFKKFTKGNSIEGKEEEIADVIKDALQRSQEIRKDMKYDSKELTDDISDKLSNVIKDKYKAKATEGERAATVNEVWEALQEQKAKLKNDSKSDEMIDYIGKKLEQDPSIGNLVVDSKAFRMDSNNQFYSIEDIRKTRENMSDAFSETIAGKLFGTKNFIEESNSPNMFFFSKGSYDPGLAKLQGGENLLKEEMLSIGDKFYKLGDDGLEHFKEADGRNFISGRAGTKWQLLDRMAGNAAERNQSNKILQSLDVMTKGGDFLDEMKSVYTKFKADEGHNWQRNLTKRFTEYNPIDIRKSNVDNYYADVKSLSEMYNESADAINSKSVDSLKSKLSKTSANILEAMESDDPLDAYTSLGLTSINKDLDTLKKKIDKDPTLKSTMTRSTNGASGKTVRKYNEILQRELLKEALFQDTATNNKNSISGYAVTLSKISDAGLSDLELNKTKNIMNWGILQERAGAFSVNTHSSKSLEEKTNSYLNLTGLLNGENSNPQDDAFLKDFKQSILKFGKDNTSVFQKLDINKNTRGGYERNQWMTVAKSFTPMDLIKDLNKGVKNPKIETTVKKMISQLIAGRNNVEDISSMTMAPYHLVNRLMAPLDKFGIGFSNASTGSTLDMVKNIGIKRILPIAAAGFALSYLNYESENLTGTSGTEAFQNAKAQFGLGTRILSSPFSGMLDRQRDNNPMAKYLFGDYKDKDEYLDYLEYGYDPVRKGRFWSFGSASEFRGGKVSYFEPNKLRQAHSNYKDIGVYGSSEEKWKHSIIPTLRHPLSTLRYLANPYWLEDKNYDSRPYPVSGKMFSEGTPWGAILNPTIGEIIKPQKRMHKEQLQGTMLDVRSIIQNRNKEIKDKAQENSIIRVDESGVTPMMFAPSSMPTMSEAIYSIKINEGKVTSASFEGQDYAETMQESSEIAPAKLGGQSDVKDGVLQFGVQKLNSQNTFDNRVTASWLTGIAGLVSSGAIQGQTAMSMINEVNEDIRVRASSSNKGEWFEKANLHTNPYRKESFKQKESYLDSMIAFDTKKDYVSDMIYSTKQLSGMYGFMFDQILPGSHGYKLEQAGKMSSFSRQFWDESIGGLGGNFMEIARRFFPHENHNITQMNPIRNTQEEWMPIRFQTGDPYTKVSKGEARLPGEGYESLNKLHSDKYGRYGAFDRYKILADIAPLSEEYKLWKKIAKSEVQHPFLKKEMVHIEERVKEQVKEHDFYNYRFLGKKMSTERATIEEVSNTGKFTIVGSDKEFTMAGIKVLKDEEGNSQVHNYLKPGMVVGLRYENNSYSNVDIDGRISAIVDSRGQNLNREMFDSGAAKEKDTKETLADEVFKLSEGEIATGHVWEALAHLPIPFLHNKFMRVNSSLETYRKEQVYGTPYSTWDHPIKGFIKPAFQEALAAPPIHQAIGIAAWGASEYFKESDNKLLRTAANGVFAMANPSAFAGGVIGAIPKMSLSDSGVWNAHNGARIGATIGLAGYALSNTQNPLLSVANFAALGIAAQEQFKFKGLNHGTGALIGAVTGLAISGLNPESDIFNLSKKYIPKDTEKKWEIEEYFDRLEYMKYTSLFHKTARKAKRKEGVDVNRIINEYERNKEKNDKIIDELEEQKKKAERMIDEQAKNQLIATLDGKINELLTPIQYLKAGEYTKSALAYKKAADTTMYGLSEDATTADVLRSLPKYDRDFFLDFANVKDPKERKKILETVSPYKAKALKIMWGEEFKEQESNNNFFNNHNLPNMFWAGWHSNVDLDNVKMKTIENEGMMLSDFGMYESAKNDPAAIRAPEIREMNSSTNPLSLQANMLSLLNGVGFQSVDVSVETTKTKGIQIIANVSRIATYNIGGSVSSVLNNLIL